MHDRDMGVAERRRQIVIIGAGGHAKVVIDALQRGRQHQIAGLLERDPSKIGICICGIPVIGTDAELSSLLEQGVDGAVIGIGHIGHGEIRDRIAQRLHASGIPLITVIHPSAVVSPHAHVGAGTLICAGAVVNPGAEIGENCIINSGAVIEHDVVLGCNVHVAPNAAISGGCVVGSHTFVGMGSCVIQGLKLGDGCIVGAGSVVLKDVEAGMTVVGSPARRIMEGI